jgi:hypothetical protein
MTMSSTMNIGKACAIFMQIDSDQYTDLEKGFAVYMVLAMPTHNGITKDAMLRVIKWLHGQHFEVEAAEDANQE